MIRVDIFSFKTNTDSGIRPKLKGLDQKQNVVNATLLDQSGGDSEQLKDSLDDFYIRQTQPGFINLLGIESPGLTSSLAIGEYVAALVRREVWGLANHKSRDGRVSELGQLEAWE